MTTDPPLDYHIRFEDSLVEVTGDGQTLRFTLSHPADADRLSGVFAAWVLLPIAMVLGRDIRIHAGGDAVTEKNFEKLTTFWSTVMPEKFYPAKVSFTQSYYPEKEASDCDLLLYSGGVDSTYNLLLRHEARKKQALLTIHGIDYKEDDCDRFERLLKKTTPLVEMIGSQRLFLITNAYGIYRHYQINADIGHAFVLASSLFLVGAKYRQAEISADYSRYQEFLIGLWGTNSLTNPLFESSSLKMHTANLDVARAAKLPLIRRYPEAMSAISFCKDYSFRPENCGVCGRCLRTKAMFLAWDCEVPAIFADTSFTSEMFFEQVDRGRISRGSVADIYLTARNNGMLGNLPGIKEKLVDLSAPPKKKPKVEKEPKVAKAQKVAKAIKKPQPWYRRIFGTN